MDLEPSTLLAALVVGGAGFVLFRYGKAQQRLPHLITGLVLMVFPYFVGGVIPMFAVGAAIVGALWFATRMGY